MTKDSIARKTGRPATIVASVYAGLTAVALGAAIWSGSSASPVARPTVLAVDSARLLSAHKSAAAMALIRREASLRPYDATVWCRLASARLQQSGRLDGEVEALLLRSYEAAPIDIDAVVWRSEFVFDHWAEVSPRLRELASREVRTFAGIFTTESVVAQTLANVHDPVGRFALRMTIAQSKAPAWSNLRR